MGKEVAEKSQNKKMETGLLTGIMFVTAGATLLEVFADEYFMIWSTSEICVILYFLELTIQQIIFEPLTGAFSRLYYDRTIEKMNGRYPCVIAVIDINNLKQVNDTYGHRGGDDAICVTANALMDSATKQMNLYRIGGDEFVMMMKGSDLPVLEQTLRQAEIRCCNRKYPFPVSFACGAVCYTPDQDLTEFLARADFKMYSCKKRMKLVPVRI